MSASAGGDGASGSDKVRPNAEVHAGSGGARACGLWMRAAIRGEATTASKRRVSPGIGNGNPATIGGANSRPAICAARQIGHVGILGEVGCWSLSSVGIADASVDAPPRQSEDMIHAGMPDAPAETCGWWMSGSRAWKRSANTTAAQHHRRPSPDKRLTDRLAPVLSGSRLIIVQPTKIALSSASSP